MNRALCAGTLKVILDSFHDIVMIKENKTEYLLGNVTTIFLMAFYCIHL